MGQNVFSLTFLGGIWKRDEKGAINIFTKTFYLGEVPLNKVAAAKELGWSAIRAKSLGWLGDEEALRCIPDWDPVGLLYKHGFDIYSEDYRESAGYKNVAGNEIVIGNSQCGYYMSLDEYIKKYLLTKKMSFVNWIGILRTAALWR